MDSLGELVFMLPPINSQQQETDQEPGLALMQAQYLIINNISFDCYSVKMCSCSQ